MLSDILVYHLLKGANVSEYHEQLTTETIPELKYGVKKTQLKKIFRDNSGGTCFEDPRLDKKVKSI